VDALTRMAELRRRQGRVREAEELLACVSSHRFHPLVEGFLALDRGDVATALEAAARFLRRIGEADRFERVTGLELFFRAAVAGGEARVAQEAAQELGAIAAATPTAPLRAAALLANGRVAAAQGDAGAGLLLEDATDLFDAAGARYDAALARLELATWLRSEGRASSGARAEARARDSLRELGAYLPKQRVGELSPRETELLDCSR
jgi:LuxR family transcriptional regulator, maltose regulon positive regulatory protein